MANFLYPKLRKQELMMSNGIKIKNGNTYIKTEAEAKGEIN